MAHAFVIPAKRQRRMRFSYRNSHQRRLAEPNILHFAGQGDALIKERIAAAMGEDVNTRLGISPE